MKILVIGGTSFVGRAISWSAWHHGHEITVFNRGVTPSDLPDSVQRLHGDRGHDLSALAGHTFDATIDVTAYRPSDVERLALAIGDHGGHYIQISSVSAYEEPEFEAATEETASLWPAGAVDPESPITGETYGPLKAASERAGLAFFGNDTTMVRPTYVVGSFDSTLRFPYWVERLRRGGEVAIPSPSDVGMQYVDARDLANFVVRVAEDSLRGAFHVAGPPPPMYFREVITAVAAHVAPAHTTLREVSYERIASLQLEDKFPLWTGRSAHHGENVLALDSSLAISHGLDLRPLEDSVDDVLEWWGDRDWPSRWLTSEDEARLFAN